MIWPDASQAVLGGAYHLDCTNEEYHADMEHDSSSSLRTFEESPAGYYHKRVTGRLQRSKPTAAMRSGDLKHIAVIEPERYEKLAIVPPRTVLAKDGKRSGKAYLEWSAEHPDNIQVSQKEHDDNRWIQAVVWRNPNARRMLDAATLHEYSIFWTSPDGYKLKARIDLGLELESILCDVKNTENPPKWFKKSMKLYNYMGQAALYVDAYISMFGVVPAFRYLLIGSKAPYWCCVRKIPPEVIQWGRRINAVTLARLYQCKEGHRPWYREGDDQVIDLEGSDTMVPENEDGWYGN